MDMGTERIVAKGSADRRATVHGKFEQYDRYLTSGRFARTYAACGDFRLATILFVTLGEERIENIRQAASNLPPRFHQYYRLATFERAMNDFFGPIWKSRDVFDTLLYRLVTPAAQ